MVEVIEMPFKHGGLQLMGRIKLANQLRGKFDVAYVCPNSLKSALLPWMAGIAKRVGYTGEMRFGLLTDRLPNPGTSRWRAGHFAGHADAAQLWARHGTPV